MMIGYACDETDSFLPAPIYYAHKLAERLSTTRKEKLIEGLGPDGKTQVTVEYNNGEIKRIDSIVISVQHIETINTNYLKKSIVQDVIKKTILPPLIDERTKIFINPSGRFVIGGPMADSGLTGRKIIVDTYGGFAGHGGGAFSGKDPTKVDRAGAYMARYIAKNIVASGLTQKCEVELAYAIGMATPISVFVNTFTGDEKMEKQIIDRIKSKLDLTPQGIISIFNLRRPIYKKIAVFGHFGRNNLYLPWEHINKDLFKNI
jgi:S-adenosylmethionine synthetase